MIFLLSGAKAGEQLIVALWTLRKVFHGGITLFIVPNEETLAIARFIKDDDRLNVDIATTERFDDCPRPDWLTKTFVYLQTPYDYTIYCDADTAIMTDPTPIFDEFAVAKCADLRVLDDAKYPKSVRRQLYKFRPGGGPVLNSMLDEMNEANLHVCNNGVIVFRRRHPLLYQMHHLCFGLRQQKMHDELALNLMLPQWPEVKRIGGEWNALVAYQPNWQHANIIHWHHKYWYHESPSRSSWIDLFNGALADNVADLQNWFGRYNWRVRALRRLFDRPVSYAL